MSGHGEVKALFVKRAGAEHVDGAGSADSGQSWGSNLNFVVGAGGYHDTPVPLVGGTGAWAF